MKIVTLNEADTFEKYAIRLAEIENELFELSKINNQTTEQKVKTLSLTKEYADISSWFAKTDR